LSTSPVTPPLSQVAVFFMRL